MKKFWIPFLLLIFVATAQAQYRYASRIAPLPALPASCDPLNGDVVFLTAGAGVSPGLYSCTAAGVWRPAGWIGNGQAWTQGTIVGSTPVYNHTVTWNNAGVVFHNMISNTTNTASAGGSTLASWQIGAVPVFQILPTYVEIAASNMMFFTGRSTLSSAADARMTMANAAFTAFTRLSFGGEAASNMGLTVSAAVGGQAQGFIFTKGDGVAAVFADLGAATNGSVIYFSNCTIASPCAGAGTGAIAKRLNNIWVCN
jgi:hypothetical protein